MPQPVTVEACLLSWNTSWWGLECHGYYGRLPAPRLGPAHKKKLKLDRLAPSSSANGGAGFAHASVHVKGGRRWICKLFLPPPPPARRPARDFEKFWT